MAVGDTIVGVNGESCAARTMAQTVALIQAAGAGPKVLQVDPNLMRSPRVWPGQNEGGLGVRIVSQREELRVAKFVLLLSAVLRASP